METAERTSRPMPRKPKTVADAAPLFEERDSGSTGGPPNAQGIAYQLNVAVYETCQLIPEALASPLKNPFITMESRAIHDEGITRWDLSVTTPTRHVEVKRNPTRKDVIEWLDRASRARGDHANFVLIYAGTSAKIIRSTETLIRIAKEASGDSDRFRSLCRFDRVDDLEAIASHLGAAAAELLHRMDIRHLPESVVTNHVHFMARFLAPLTPERVVQELRDKLFEGLQHRTRYSVHELIAYLRAKGLSLEIPQNVVLAELSATLRGAIAVLGHCTIGLPSEALAAVLDCSVSEVPNAMAPLIQSGHVIEDAGRWRLLIQTGKVPLEEERACVDKGLSALLRYIDRYNTIAEGRMLVPDVISLTRACYHLDPRAIIRVFPLIEKLLKRIGNKHLVLDLADLTIAASHVPPIDEPAARARAKALICGRSWAFQRLDDLDRARVEADESLRLGEEIGWQQNTAFCLKCTGRLVRLQAEKLPRGNLNRNELLEESVRLLERAIESFVTIPDFGSSHPEVGDCYSLIARTYLVAGKYEDAQEAVRKAFALIPADGRKDHLDLLILSGDLEAAQGRREAADRYYSQAIELPEAADVQISEMFARAYFQRAKARARLRRTEAAVGDFEKASRIWTDTEEHERAAEAEWEARVLKNQIEAIMKEVFETTPSYLVRITAHNNYLSQSPSLNVIARRQALPRPQIEQLLKDARRNVAIEYPRA
jgi:tetratricopeptide (TPR) repeat protein